LQASAGLLDIPIVGTVENITKSVVDNVTTNMVANVTVPVLTNPLTNLTTVAESGSSLKENLATMVQRIKDMVKVLSNLIQNVSELYKMTSTNPAVPGANVTELVANLSQAINSTLPVNVTAPVKVLSSSSFL
jgi:hypothetical protein